MTDLPCARDILPQGPPGACSPIKCPAHPADPTSLSKLLRLQPILQLSSSAQSWWPSTVQIPSTPQHTTDLLHPSSQTPLQIRFCHQILPQGWPQPCRAGGFPRSSARLSSPALQRQRKQCVAAGQHWRQAAQLLEHCEHHEALRKGQGLLPGEDPGPNACCSPYNSAPSKGAPRSWKMLSVPQLTRAAETRTLSGGGKGKARSWMDETSLYPGLAPPTSPGSQNPHEPLAEGRCEQAGGTRPLVQSR